VLGDSISLSVAPVLSRLGFDITGRVGQSASVEYLRTHLSSPEAQAAPTWVIMLGTNNRGDENDLANLRSWIREIRTARDGRPRQHVYWVTPHRPDEYDGGMSTHTLDALTDALRAEAARRPWLTVLDFDLLAREHPEWFAQDGARLHPNTDGQAALVDLIAGAGAPEVESAGAIVEIPLTTPAPRAPEPQDEPEFPAEEFTNG
jgi:lysophospholipase L1-like esterase